MTRTSPSSRAPPAQRRSSPIDSSRVASLPSWRWSLAGAGLAAEALGRVAEWCWMGSWGGPPGRALTAWRRRRWTLAADRYHAALQAKARLLLSPGAALDGGALGGTARVGAGSNEAAPGDGAPPVPGPGTDALNAARNRIALAEPRSPTWMGDRMLAAGIRVRARYDLDLVSAWPRLWLLVPEEVRGRITSARDDLASAARLAGWGVLYLLPALWWWPAALIGAACIGSAWWLGRHRTGRLADLVEATADVHGRDLARSLGIDCPAEFTPAIGESVTRVLRKGN
ncbi:hypothetical protein [Sphaerisporangium perillae]|uniref:hypothetical protein n=1 Tax=Sphaerisporangium perillae TaxID=2935860 RepID=UPI00200C66C5|nr:hypothetical protein [Sphaerisporangium perillae]